MCWLVVDGKEIKWCFKEGFDFYVKAGLGWDFYGKLDGKVWIIFLFYEVLLEMFNEEYDLWFCIGCVFEYWYIGIMICCVFELYKVVLDVLCFMYYEDV